MKKSVLLNVVLALALVIVCVRAHLGKIGSAGTDADSSQVVYNTILTRASVRSYLDKPVEDEKIEMLLRAGMAAPSAVNAQPWHFIVVKNPDTLGKIAELTPNASMAKDAPLAIVVCGDMDKEKDDKVRPFWIQDTSAATENILLQAHAMGLGAVWTGTYPSEERCKAIATLLKLPKNIIPLNTIVIGYPKGYTAPKDKWKPENVSYELYGNNDSKQAATQKSESKAPVFEDFNVNEKFRQNPFTFFKGNGLLLAAGDRKSHNAMTIGWGALGNIWEPDNATITVYVAQGRYTHQFMEKARYFTVMEFDKAHANVLDYMGHHSGRDGDKAKHLGLHTLYTEHGTPYFAEASTVYECEMLYHAPFDPKGFGEVPREFYKTATAGIHSMYIGKIVKAMKKK